MYLTKHRGNRLSIVITVLIRAAVITHRRPLMRLGLLIAGFCLTLFALRTLGAHYPTHK